MKTLIRDTSYSLCNMTTPFYKHFHLILIGMLCLNTPLLAVLKGNITNKVQAKPGDVIPMKIIMENQEEEPTKVSLKICDYSYNCQGENFFPTPGTYPRSSASWIDLYSDQIVIPPKKEVEIFYKIRVPANPGLKGSYWSVIMIEPDKVWLGQKASDSNQMQLNIKIRYAYQVIVNIGEGDAGLKVLNREVAKQDGKTELVIDVLNNGEVFLQPNLILKMYDQKGNLVKKFESKEQKIFPETSVRYILDVTDLESKHYTGLMLLDNNDDNLFGDRFDIAIP